MTFEWKEEHKRDSVPRRESSSNDNFKHDDPCFENENINQYSSAWENDDSEQGLSKLEKQQKGYVLDILADHPDRQEILEYILENTDKDGENWVSFEQLSEFIDSEDEYNLLSDIQKLEESGLVDKRFLTEDDKTVTAYNISSSFSDHKNIASFYLDI
ncbi:hypothetical protein Har1131_07825 [Haloarcula sp. CBA1131]|uniref:hypothetical protein n=1 Tax=Haloarcula sp. CBA1131 TaxID=1853686 RepID=UPI0012483CAC|nr:hypothetical protein [Haloarcula sp. CBA1131]KAA9406711.1 hypothetical protein Har1131_07825 [Haloarcula sp. CBA1131]